MSEDSAAVVAGLILKRGVTGRCTYSAEAKRALARLCSQPGVSVARLALTHGVNANLLRKWQLQFGESAPSTRSTSGSKSAVTLLPVAVAEESKSSAGWPEGCIEILLGAATVRLRGAVDPGALATVLDCLAQRS